MKKILFVVRLIVAVILLQTLFYKFTAHPDSVYIFTTLGLEPFGRIGIGIAELIAAILLIVPKTAWLGSGLSLGIISGAVFSHLTQLGIVVNGDGGLLFYLALIVMFGSAIILWSERKNIPFISNYLKESTQLPMKENTQEMA